MNFDDALPRLIKVCEQLPGFTEAVEVAVVVRDLRGRLRLALRQKDDRRVEIAKLQSALSAEIGVWFEPPVLVEDRTLGSATGRLARAVIDMPHEHRALWYERAPGDRVEASKLFRLVERRLSKLSWLTNQRVEPPWKLLGRNPVIVTFYSFKGGVGRTTLAAAVALHLARKGKQVTTIDLDLEAPGLGNLLGAVPGRGALDAIVGFLATNQLDLGGLVQTASALGDESASVRVLGAGELNREYFEKLARLDFVGGIDASVSPVEEALRQLLKVIKSDAPQPDIILIDARAGLHDLAGLSLFGLAHLDVIVARDSPQSLEGLDLVIELLSQRPPDALTLMVHSMAAADKNAPEAIRSEVAFRERVYDSFMKHVYENDAPSVGDDAAHTPWIIRSSDRLHRFVNFDSIRDVLLGAEYAAVADRILELSKPGEFP